MAYKGEGRGRPLTVFVGESHESLDNAIRAAVHASDVEEHTKLVITHIEVETVGDPNIGSYRVVLSKGT
jgi:hypothetical protein